MYRLDRIAGVGNNHGCPKCRKRQLFAKRQPAGLHAATSWRPKAGRLRQARRRRRIEAHQHEIHGAQELAAGPVELLSFAVDTYNGKPRTGRSAKDGVHFELEGETLGLEDVVEQCIQPKAELLIVSGPSRPPEWDAIKNHR